MKVIHKDATDKYNAVEIPCSGVLLGLPLMSIGATLPNEAIKAGWRVLETATRGPNYKASEWIDDGLTLREVAVDYTPEEVEAQNAARRAIENEYRAEQEHAYLLAVERVTPLAAQYRDLLRKHFGVGAELNHEVTQESVLGYFALITATGAITAQQTAEAALIQTLFVALAPLATDMAYSDQNTWSEDFWALIA
jgi:hypothetical protein